MSEKQAKAARAATIAPAPILAGAPIPLPAAFQGDYAGAAVVFDLDRVLEFDFVAHEVMATVRAEQAALDATHPSADADEATIRTYNLAQRDCNHRWAATRCAYLVYGFAPGPALPRDDAAAWAALSLPVVRWIATEGVKLAIAQTAAPFLASALPA